MLMDELQVFFSIDPHVSLEHVSAGPSDTSKVLGTKIFQTLWFILIATLVVVLCVHAALAYISDLSSLPTEYNQIDVDL